jgi:hypothetical protein
LLPGTLTENLRVPSGTYTFMSLDPSTTLADFERHRIPKSVFL